MSGDIRGFRGIWIPASLWLDKTLTINEKIVLMEIDSYDNEFGCVASNATIGKNLHISSKAVSNVIQSLQNKKVVDVYYDDYNSFSGRKIHVIYGPLLSLRQHENMGGVHKTWRGSTKHGGVPQNMEGGTRRREHSNTFSNIYSSISTNVDTEQCDQKKEQQVQAKLFEVEPKKTKEKKKSYRQEIVDFFHEFYLQEKHTKYKFQDKDFGNISNLIKTIKEKLIEEGNNSPTDQQVADATKYFISASYHNGTDWFKNEFTPTMVYSHFNQSFSKLKNGIDGTSKKSRIESERNRIEKLFG